MDSREGGADVSILHVDLNSFYAHCAVVESGGKYTFDTPLIVGGDQEKRHGIVLAATYCVKKKGVRAGMPLINAASLCPEAVVVSPDFKLYSYYSDKFMSILRDYSPLIMRFGIDEAYVDYGGCEHLFGTAQEAAEMIRQRVKRELGLTVSVGVGDNMLMAKMGSDYKKPDAVTVVTREFWHENIMKLPVGNLMYVGSSSVKKLNLIGITTIGELAAASEALIKSLFGASGRQMWLHANGIDNEKITLERAEQKSISSSFTLPGDIRTRDELFSALLSQTDKVAYRLRAQGVKAKTVGVSVRYSDMTHKSRQTRLSESSDVTSELYDTAKALILPLYNEKSIRQVGMSATIDNACAEQLSLFSDSGHEKNRSVDKAVDALKTRFGEDVIWRASTSALRSSIDSHNPFGRADDR